MVSSLETLGILSLQVLHLHTCAKECWEASKPGHGGSSLKWTLLPSLLMGVRSFFGNHLSGAGLAGYWFMLGRNTSNLLNPAPKNEQMDEKSKGNTLWNLTFEILKLGMSMLDFNRWKAGPAVAFNVSSNGMVPSRAIWLATVCSQIPPSECSSWRLSVWQRSLTMDRKGERYCGRNGSWWQSSHDLCVMRCYKLYVMNSETKSPSKSC